MRVGNLVPGSIRPESWLILQLSAYADAHRAGSKLGWTAKICIKVLKVRAGMPIKLRHR